LDKRWDIGRIMLTVRVQGDGIVRYFESKGKAFEKRGSFTHVLVVADDGRLRERSEDLGG
jgi:hypothetical protein